MGRQHEAIEEKMARWIESQPVYFVATAPTGPEGHVNVSPKGGSGTVRVLGPRRVAYLDMTGSGIETVAHLKQNGRITVMFCAFDGPPKIIRLYGTGSIVVPEEAEWGTLIANFNPSDEITKLVRAMIVVDVERIQDSCGFVVPRMQLVEEREHLFRWADEQQRKNGDGWDLAYRQANNRLSIDNLIGLELPDPDDQATAKYASEGRAL